jgi:hypothetical protein
MRTKLLILSCGLSFFTRATVLTVSNDPNRPAQYTSVTTAYNAAAAGDTLYIYGSPNNYGALNINKSITLIGNGFNPRKEVFYHSYFGNITMNNNASSVTIDGITFPRFIPDANTAFTYNNITLKNCYIYQDIKLLAFQSPPACGSSISNWLIQNCYINTLNFGISTGCNPVSPVTTGILIKNCHVMTLYSMNGAQFVNCQFGNDIESGYFASMRNNVFDNCIFERYEFSQNSDNVNNIFHNCLTYLTAQPSINFDLNSWTNGASGSATGCIINQNPLFVYGNPNRNLQCGVAERINWNPSLQPGSPAINAGTDGTNIGINGGTTAFMSSGEPNISVIRKFQLINTVVPSNGTVTLKATATKAQ